MAHLRRGLAAAVASASIVGGLHAAAGTLGGLTTQQVAAWDAPATISTPAIITCDDFSRASATGSALANRPVQLPATCGSGVWSTELGTWTIGAGQLAASSANATATISAGQTDISATATILNAHGGGRIAGVAIDHSGSTRKYLAATLSGPNTVQLRLVDGSTITILASASASITATTVIRITRAGSTVTISVNGTLALTYTLSAGQITTVATGTKVGLYWNSGTTVRFTNISATQPSAP